MGIVAPPDGAAAETVIDRAYPLTDVRAALDRVATKQARGKVLVVP